MYTTVAELAKAADTAFDAGNRDWLPTTVEVAEHFLEAVPPIYAPSNKAFACGEAYDHTDMGIIYLTFRNIDYKAGTAEARHGTVKELRTL